MMLMRNHYCSRWKSRPTVLAVTLSVTVSCILLLIDLTCAPDDKVLVSNIAKNK